MSRPTKRRRRPGQVSASPSSKGRTPPRADAPRYPGRGKAKMALAPGIILAIVLLAGLALVGTDEYVFVLYTVAILAAVMSWFAIQAHAWWWLIGLLPLVVLWNPVLPFAFPDVISSSLHLVGIGITVAAGLIIRVPVDD